jgi:hypothetical protein
VRAESGHHPRVITRHSPAQNIAEDPNWGCEPIFVSQSAPVLANFHINSLHEGDY